MHSADGDGSTLFAEVGLPGDIRSQQSGYGIHPALLDACFQSVAAGFGPHGRTDGGLLLPLSVTRLRRFGPGRDARYCLARIALVRRRRESRPIWTSWTHAARSCCRSRV